MKMSHVLIAVVASLVAGAAAACSTQTRIVPGYDVRGINPAYSGKVAIGPSAVARPIIGIDPGKNHNKYTCNMGIVTLNAPCQNAKTGSASGAIESDMP